MVNGPLPLMTLFRRMATPHGFDEALPKGHEDYAGAAREQFVVQYRFKKNSKMRNREKFNPEVPRLMRGLFPDLYPVRKLLVDGLPNGRLRMDVSVSQHLICAG